MSYFTSALYYYRFLPLTAKVVSSNPAHGEVYTIQRYVIKVVSDLRQVGSFLMILRFSPPINWPPRYNWIIVESGVKHPVFQLGIENNPNPIIHVAKVLTVPVYNLYITNSQKRIGSRTWRNLRALGSL